MRYQFTVYNRAPINIDRSSHKKKRGSFIARLLSFIMIPLLLAGIIMFLIYPHYNDMVLAKESLNAEQMTNSTVLGFFTTISPKTAKDTYAEDFDNKLAMEYIDPDLIAQYSNEGTISSNLEDDNTNITIRSANIDAGVIDGEDAFAMEKGPWHFPLSDGPGEKGNFVIIGHRFAELPPSTNTFFNLDKIDVGDKIIITQNGGIDYTYTVIESKVVEKNDRTVLQSVGDYRITLITCTPLWTSKERLVVTAVLDRAYQTI